MIEPEAPLGADREIKEAKFKWHEKGGKGARSEFSENKDKKQKRESKDSFAIRQVRWG